MQNKIFTPSLENQWQQYALNNNWRAIIEESEKYDLLDNKKAVIWRIKSLRALEKGNEANNELVRIAQGKYEVSLEIAIELSEELIQCSMFQLVDPIIDILIEKKHPAGYFLKISALREQAKYSEALNLIEKLKDFGENWENLSKISEVWIRIRQGTLNQAEKCLEQVNNINNLSTQKLITRFEIASNQIDKAYNRLIQITKRQPLDWEWPHLLASVLLSRKEDPVKCLNLINLGLRRQPRQAEAYALIAKIQLDLNNKSEAKKAMVQSLMIKPWLDAAVVPFIDFEINKRNYKEALVLIKEYQKIANTPRRQAVALEVIRFNNAKNKEIIIEAEFLAKKYPDEPAVLRTCAAALISCSKRDPAAKILEKIIALNKYDNSALNNLAVLYKERGDIDQAIKLWNNLVEKGDLVSKINLAQAYLIAGDLVKSENIWNELNGKMNGENSLIERGYAEIYVKKGEFNKALNYIKKACELEEKNPKNWVMQAQLLSIIYDQSTSIKFLEKIENNFDSKIEIHKELFKLYEKQATPKEIINKITKWQEYNPKLFDYLQMKLTVYNRVSDFNSAENILKQAIKLDSQKGTIQYIRFKLERGKFEEARKLAIKWLSEDDTDIRRYGQLSEVYFMENDLNNALQTVNHALLLDPYRSSLVRQKIGILLNKEEYEAAENCAINLWNYNKEPNSLSLWLRTIDRINEKEKAIQIVQSILKEKPDDQVLRLELAKQFSLAGNFESCAELLTELNKNDPSNEVIAQNLIQILMKLLRKNEAIKIIRDFAKLQPNRFDVQINLADFALEQGFFEESREILNQLRQVAPEYIQVFISLTSLERKEGNSDEEINHWKYIASNFQPARWVNMAINHWVRLGLEKELEVILNEWREKEPNNPTPWWYGFNLAKQLKRYNIAESNLKGVERRIGTNSQILSARAMLMSDDFKMSEAERLITNACLNSPIDTTLLELKIGINLKSGNWNDFDKDFERLCYLLSENKYGTYGRMFFNLNCHPDWSEAKLFSFYKEWGERVIKPLMTNNKYFDKKRNYNKKLRIGYISPDFRMHAVAKFALPIIANHQKISFETFGYAYLENSKSDKVTLEFKNAFDHWRETQHWSIDELENNIRNDNIDILVDLAGHTTNTQILIFNRRVAPIQASHIIGAGQTTGMPSTDYLIATNSIWPETEIINAVEKVERLPFKGLIFEIPTDALPPSSTPSLKSGFIVFGVFARPIRINENVIRVWSDILKNIPKSIIRFEHVPYLEIDIQERFINIFSKYGVSKDRLQFRHTRPYWRAFQEIDIQLDPFPAGSGTTATEGLYMGRLVITKQDRVAMGRMAHAQLEALELDSLCSAKTTNEYVAMACLLANDLDKLNKISLSIRDKFLKSTLVDYKGYSLILENTFLKWWNTYMENKIKL